MLISLLLSGLVSSILLYMHKADPTISLIIPLFLFSFSIPAAIFFSIIFVAAFIEDKRYRIPNFLIILSLFPLFYDSAAGFLSGMIFVLPIFVMFITSNLMNKKILTQGDVKLFFAIGVFFRNVELVFPFYIVCLIFFVPYSLFKKKLVPLGPPAAIAAYLLYLIK